MNRRSGVIAHPSSFPSPYGIGDLGAGAYEFVDFLHKAKQNLWQILPLGPTGYGDSPYQSFSTFAGNHYLISPDLLVEEGLLTEDDVKEPPHFDPLYIDYGQMIEYKMSLFYKAFKRFAAKKPKSYEKFCNNQKAWLVDYALFVALKKHFIQERSNEIDSPGLKLYTAENESFLTEEQAKDYYYGAIWTSWPVDIAGRETSAIAKYTKLLADEIEFQKFLQYEFFTQWQDLRKYANKNKIKIVGDVPIFVAMDSSDVWSEPDLFQLDKAGNPKVVAGVPPDYFSETGQLWGNPLYNWANHKKQGYEWWTRRMASLLALVDIIRIDHFIGFCTYWAVPYGEETAINGKWIKGPGKPLFTAISKKLGELPVIAEDLGVITESVKELRDALGFPGMAILHFAFTPDGTNPYIPHNLGSNTVVYTGTHDNDTSYGWYRSAPEDERDYYHRYMNVSGEAVPWDLIRLAWSSVAKYAITTIQDILSLGTEARMNTPGLPTGNWCFRYTKDSLTNELADRLAYLTQLFNRTEKTKKI